MTGSFNVLNIGFAGGTGSYTQTGGTLNDNGSEYVGANSYGSFTQSGGSNNAGLLLSLGIALAPTPSRAPGHG